MNEGIAKALRRQTRARGHQTTAPGRGTVIPGKETKTLWAALNHRQRGEWRSKLPPTRAALRRRYSMVLVRVAAVLCTGRVSYNGAQAMLPRSR